MTDYSELIDRMWGVYKPGCRHCGHFPAVTGVARDDMRDAADAIEALAAENEQLRRWQQEACIAIEAASELCPEKMNLANHDRLLREATE